MRCIPYDKEEIVVDWNGGEIETNVGERYDDDVQVSDNILGEYFVPLPGDPPEVPWNVMRRDDLGMELPEIRIGERKTENRDETSQGRDPLKQKREDTTIASAKHWKLKSNARG